MIKKLALMICLVGFLAGCERPLKVSLDGKNPPTFRFDGSGELSWVYIYQVTPEGKIPLKSKDSELWIIVPKQVITASASPPITYGVVPSDFAQHVPANGNPPALEEGKVYGFGADTRGQPGGAVWFTIRDGKSVQVPKTDPPGKPW
jgi:hypothetical protein